MLYSVTGFVDLKTSREKPRAFSMTNVWPECLVSDRKCKTKYRSRPFLIPAIWVSFHTRDVWGKGWFDSSPPNLENKGTSQDCCSHFPEGWRDLPWRECSSACLKETTRSLCFLWNSFVRCLTWARDARAISLLSWVQKRRRRKCNKGKLNYSNNLVTFWTIEIMFFF